MFSGCPFDADAKFESRWPDIQISTNGDAIAIRNAGDLGRNLNLDPHAIVSGLSIENVEEDNRDKFRNLISEGGVLFRSLAGKTWFCRFSEFSFLVNHPV